MKTIETNAVNETNETITPLVMLNDKDFSKLLSNMGTSLEKSRELVQLACLQALVMAELNGSYNRATEVYKAVNQKFNKRSAEQVKLWFFAMGPFRFSSKGTKTDAQGGFRKDKSEHAVPFNIVMAVKTKWFSMQGFSDEEKEMLFGASKVHTRVKNVAKDLAAAINGGTRLGKVMKLDGDKQAAQALFKDLETLLKKHGVSLDDTAKEAKAA